MALERATDHSERAKAAGNTPAQKELREYHEGAFQTHDPVTGEKRSEPLPELVEDAIQPTDAEQEEAEEADADAPARAAKKAAKKRR